MKGPLDVQELRIATHRLVKNIHSISFTQGLKCLQLEMILPKDSKLLSLNPFLDQVELIHTWEGGFKMQDYRIRRNINWYCLLNTYLQDY